MFRRYIPLIILAIIALIATGCSNSSSPATPVDTPKTPAIDASHSLWGLWQGTIDPDAQTIDFIQLRHSAMHLNALVFLEPPPFVNLSLDSLEFNGDIVTADIGLRHPFLGLTEFTGFDVCGIFISNGSVSGYSDTDIIMAGDGDTRLLNPDGYTRWWNPSEFPSDGTMFGYKDGLLGTPDSVGNFNATVNGYKYFCDDLDGADDPLGDVTLENHGMFSAGQKNVRRYEIEMGAGLVFNYAVDANWTFPSGDPPFTAPDDFGINANRPEAWRVDISETTNTLYNNGLGALGGNLSLSIDIHDWFDANLNSVRVESPGNFPMIESASPTGGGEGYSTYEIDITDATPAEGSISLLISVISEVEDFGGFISGTNVTSYFTTDVAVDDEEPQQSDMKNIPLRVGFEALDVTVQQDNGDCWILYDDDQVWRHTSADSYQTGTYVFTVTCAEPSHDFHPLLMDANALGVIAFGHNTPTLTVCWTWRYTTDGTYMNESGLIGACTQRWLPDITFFGNSGTWANHACYFCGGYWQSSSWRNWWYLYGPPDYNSHDMPNGSWCSNLCGTGLSGVDRINVTALETDLNGANLWILEGNTENTCTMWEHTQLGYPYLNYANSYFPSPSTAAYWHDPVDLTRDDTNRLMLLDEDSGQAIISAWTGSSTGGTYIGQVGGPETISEQPRRIDGSDFDGKVFVIHGDSFGPTEGYLLSIFEASELPS